MLRSPTTPQTSPSSVPNTLSLSRQYPPSQHQQVISTTISQPSPISSNEISTSTPWNVSQPQEQSSQIISQSGTLDSNHENRQNNATSPSTEAHFHSPSISSTQHTQDVVNLQAELTKVRLSNIGLCFHELMSLNSQK
jgi:hypothetical protein